MKAQRPIYLMHVTTVPFSLNFFRGQIGYLRDHGFKVDGVSSPGEYLEEFSEREGITCHGIQMARDMDPLRDVVSLWRLWRLFRTQKPDIVHSHTPKAGLIGTIAARLARRPVVVLSIFGLAQMTINGPKRHLLDVFTRIACSAANIVWCDSHSMRDFVVSNRLCPAKKVVVFGKGSVNGVDAMGRFLPDAYGPEVRDEVRARHGIPADDLVVGYVGRVVGDKGMRELVQAWRTLRSERTNLHLLIVGPHEEKDPLTPEDDALLRSDERVHLAGPRMDVAQHFKAMDVFVMPSYREGFSITNIEAAAMTLPVVSSRIPGCVDSVEDGVTGTLVPSRDAAALAQALDRYLADPALRLRHGAAGRARVLRDFRPDTIWTALEAEYRLLLSRSKTE